jgi:hypothetical protein
VAEALVFLLLSHADAPLACVALLWLLALFLN